MKNPANSPYNNDDNLEDLLRQVDALVSDSPENSEPQDSESAGSYASNGNSDDYPQYSEDFGNGYFPEDDDDFDADAADDDGSVLYQNYSNNYGANLRNFSNGYGNGQPAPRQEPEAPPKPTPVIPAYNADFLRASRNQSEYVRGYDDDEPVSRKSSRKASRRSESDDDSYDSYREPKAPRKKKHRKEKRRRGCGCGCMTMLVMLALVVVGVLGLIHFFFEPPVSEQSIGERKPDCATVLICGTDWEGARTDTMMLVYLDGANRKVGLLSLPRDTYTMTASGNAAKLNSAYGRNGSDEKGMEGLLDYVQEIIGYRPDGYVLVSMELVTQIVDLMGGLDVEVPMTFDLEGEHLEEGMQHLSGNQVLQLLRFREGYAMQDLGRVEVQRSVIQAAMEQWASPTHVKDVFSALNLVEDHSITTLSSRNCLWIGKVLLSGMSNIYNHTLPGTATYIGGVSYYVLDRDEVADLVNDSYNPYRVQILPENLKIAG